MLTALKQVVKANREVRISANLATKYRKNVQYNLEATRGQES
jgi:DASH complex subunit DAD4